MKKITCIRLIKNTALACLLGFASYASASPNATLAIVGPKPAGIRANGPMEGYLKVYSATREYNDGDLMYYPHSRYSIYLTSGARYKWVDNHET